MDINITALEKLVEVLKEIGIEILRPQQIKRLAGAKAEEIRVVTKAMFEAEQLGFNVEYNDGQVVVNSDQTLLPNMVSAPGIVNRTRARLSAQELRRESNIEQITAHAAEELSQTESVSEEPVDPDWITRFFDISQDISNEEMQLLWGKILVGEIKQPNSFSMRTLDYVRSLSRTEAEIFTRVGNLALSVEPYTFLLNLGGNFSQPSHDVSYVDILKLREIGLLNADQQTQYTLPEFKTDSDVRMMNYGNYGILLMSRVSPIKPSIPVIMFTAVGTELLRLIPRDFQLPYVQQLAALLSPKGITVQYGQIKSVDRNDVTFADLQDVI